MTAALDAIAALNDLPTNILRKRWSRVFHQPCPKGLSRDLVIRALAYHTQEQAQGGLTARDKRQLATLAKKPATKDGDGSTVPASLKPGTRLIREWRAQTYTVTVLEGGFDHKGQRYNSLSEVARKITGARWSGPRFFGLLKKPSRAVENPQRTELMEATDA